MTSRPPSRCRRFGRQTLSALDEIRPDGGGQGNRDRAERRPRRHSLDGPESKKAVWDDGLISQRPDRPETKYQAEIRDVFFVAGQPRTRRIFTRDGNGRVTGFVDRREGEDVRWTRSE